MAYLSSGLYERVVKESTLLLQDDLTPREYEVLDLLASGLTDREIAEQLVVSEETARTYTKRLLKTLEVNNRVQAVLKGMRCGMVKL